jgi:protein-tyrosine-phosphatase
MKRVLFVCTENANRSQMAEAFARRHGRGVVEAWSAGSAPSGTLGPRAIRSMRARGYDLAAEGHWSKSIADLPSVEFDVVIGMGCGDRCPRVPARARGEWELVDPRDLGDGDFDRVRDDIERRVLGLIDELRAEESTASARATA